MSERQKRIIATLEAAFNPEELEVRDDSAAHAGHAGAKDGKGHFAVRIRAAAFADKTVLERHRMVYDALSEMMTSDIHALQIDAQGIKPHS